jgi:hypothetical protein
VPDAVECVAQNAELALAADELHSGLVRDVNTEPCAGLHRMPRVDRPGLSLGLDVRRVVVVDCVSRCAVRRIIDEDAVHGCSRLEPCSGVDDVARGHPLACCWAGIERDERFPRRDPGTQLEPLLESKVSDRDRGSYGALRIVLVRDRRAEERHHGIADELLDGAAVPLELTPNATVIRTKNRLDVLRVQRFSLRREADEVAEQDGDDLALAA